MTIFGTNVWRRVKPALRELGFQPRGSSKVLFERPMERGLVEYTFWVCHQWHDAFHVQWGVRHGLCDAYYGWDRDYAQTDYVGEFKYSSEWDLILELDKSLDVYQERRTRMLPVMEGYIRTQKKAKEDLVLWHGWFEEFTSAGLNNARDFRRHFSDIPPDIVDGACKFTKDLAKSIKLKPGTISRDCFLLLKVYQCGPKRFDGNWWSLQGFTGWPGSFFDHLGDLDALLEPYDV